MMVTLENKSKQFWLVNIRSAVVVSVQAFLGKARARPAVRVWGPSECQG